MTGNSAANDRRKKNTASNRKKIFISWSKQYSKEIALALKDTFENHVFKGTGLTGFVSDVDIASGEDWWQKIRKELKSSGQGIMCITKQNVKEPWIYFEGGALVANNIRTIPLLISCDIKSLANSPFDSRECIQFYEEQKFLKMVSDINEQLGLLNLSKVQLDSVSKEAYKQMKDKLSKILEDLKDSRFFNEKYIYPNNVSTVNKETVYISAPMASASDEEYKKQREFLVQLEQILKEELGFRRVVCPAIAAKDKNDFDGNTKAISENFCELKQVDHLIILYPHRRPSSTLIEAGYGIGLTKQTLILYQEELPYMLQEAGEIINHVRTHKYDNYSDVIKYVKNNGKVLFQVDSDE